MPSKNIPKSIGAVLAGFIVVVILSIGTDIILETLGILPPQTQPEAYVWWMLLVALIYRTIYTVMGGYVTAKLSPQRPMKHAVILGILGTVAGTAGAAANWNLGNHWYPVALAVLALPSTWWGGKLYAKR